MKSLLIKILTICCILCSAMFIFTGCGEEKPACAHEWYEQSRVHSTKHSKGEIVHKCSKCNETAKDVLPELSYVNDLEEILSEDCALVLNDFSFVVDGSNMEVTFAELNVTLNDEDQLIAYGSTDIIVAYLDTYENETDVYTYDDEVCINANVYYENGVFYAKVNTAIDEKYIVNGVEEYNIYLEQGAIVKIPFALFEDYIYDNFPMYMIEAIAPEAFGWLEEELLPSLDMPIALGEEALNKGISIFVDALFDVKTVGNNKEYTFSVDKIRQFNNLLYTKDLKSFVNEFFGRSAWNQLVKDTIDLIDTSFGQILLDLEEEGIDVLELVDSLDAYVTEMAIAEGIIPEGETMTIEEFLYEMTGEEIPDISAMLTNEGFKSMTLGTIIVTAVNQEGFTVDTIKQEIREVFNQLSKMTVYDIIVAFAAPVVDGTVSFSAQQADYAKEIKDMIDDGLNEIQDAISLKYVVEYQDGVAVGISSIFDVDVDGEGMSGEISFTQGYVSDVDYEQIVADVNTVDESIVLTDNIQMISGVEGYVDSITKTGEVYDENENDVGDAYGYVDADGKTYNFELTFDSQGNLVSIYYAFTAYGYITEGFIDLENSIKLIKYGCNGVYEIILLDIYNNTIESAEDNSYIYETDNPSEISIYYDSNTNAIIFLSDSYAMYEILIHNPGVNGCINCNANK